MAKTSQHLFGAWFQRQYPQWASLNHYRDVLLCVVITSLLRCVGTGINQHCYHYRWNKYKPWAGLFCFIFFFFWFLQQLFYQPTFSVKLNNVNKMDPSKQNKYGRIYSGGMDAQSIFLNFCSLWTKHLLYNKEEERKVGGSASTRLKA